MIKYPVQFKFSCLKKMTPKNINRLLVGLIILVLVGGTVTWILLSKGSQKCACKSGFKCKEDGCSFLCPDGKDPVDGMCTDVVTGQKCNVKHISSLGDCCPEGHENVDGRCAPIA